MQAKVVTITCTYAEIVWGSRSRDKQDIVYLEHCAICIARIPKALQIFVQLRQNLFPCGNQEVFYEDIPHSQGSSLCHGLPPHGISFSETFACQQRQK